jgi:hypothetical protein
MSLSSTGTSNYYFVWRRQLQHGDNTRFLPQFKGDPSAMRDLRSLLDESATGIPLARLTDDQVIAGVARLLASGELMIAKELPMHGGAAAKTDVSGNDTPPEASVPLRASGKSNAQPPESPTFSSDVDGVSQAGVLTEAAATGAALCPT